ncbi:zincin-like metallopeptidase domain-containing protein [Pseudomonas tohonis]|uniref:zincin-like metallopeptidase domain-containing protein n=1 Tax=Pseudomonas tohonis TaxID=2725477 RepID=UPI001EEB359D|nr:zincin-like metallopeptidase domain-containing protein [Pseudomonas tohonis]
MSLDNEINLLLLESQAEMLYDFVERNAELFSKNPLQEPLIPTDVFLMTKYLINDKYDFDYESQPDFSKLGAYDTFISGIADSNDKEIKEYGFHYIDSEALQGVTPQFVLENFKKALAGNEHLFSEVIAFAEKSMSERILIAEAFQPKDPSHEFNADSIYSAQIEQRFIDKAKSTAYALADAKAPVMKQEHADIDIQPGEYEELTFKSTNVECDDRTKAIFEQAGRQLIQIIESNDAVGKNPWLDPVFTLKAYNPKTGYQYNIENKVLLNDAVSTNGYETGLFLSFNEISNTPGLKIPKGTKGTPIIQRFGKKVAEATRTLADGTKEPVLDDNGEQVYIWRRAAKTATVFNIDQLEYTGTGVDPRIKWKEAYSRPRKLIASNQEELEIFKDNLIKSIHVPIVQGGHTNFYSPSRNEISMANNDLFRNDLQFIHTLLHEGLHSTGHKDVLKRESLYKYHINDFYRGFEETLVNVAAVKVVQHYGLDMSELNEAFHKNETVYNVGWARHVFNKDPMQMIEVMYKSEEAYRYAKTQIDYQLKAEKVYGIFIQDEVEPKAPAKIADYKREAQSDHAKKQYNKQKVTA